MIRFARPRAAAAGALFVAVAIATVLARLPRARASIESIAGMAAGGPAPHWLIFFGSQAAVATLGILPASLMAVMAGAAYGMAAGLMISVAGTMLGGWIAFRLSRSILRPWIAKMIGRFARSARFDDAIASEGWRFVCLLRISPVMPFAATSYGLGLTRIGERAYLLGTLASLPALATYVGIGAFGRQSLLLSNGQAGPVQWLLPIVGLAMVALAAARVKRLVAGSGTRIAATPTC